ncbi:MAG: aminotransferase class I/II-fold pyridoxal phosphate-dependent enzyme [Methylocystaceae bacterium]|jgi:aspartate/methionine/tyrosine aminotransferase|nr:aminotransferase class I/II-fold pyridoxal phosphate-dependent enzyme [Methylocystaceae bacterium]
MTTLPPNLSHRSAVSPFLAMDVLRQANEQESAGRRVIHMELGEPGGPLPLLVREAAAIALSQGDLGYGEALGERRLRRLIALNYQKRYGISVDPERVIVTTGSSGAFVLTLLAGFDAGARIAVASPGYPAYANILHSLGLEAAPINFGADTGFAPTATALEEAHQRQKLHGALFMSPANPTGAMIPEAELAKICNFCDAAGITFISDEIYHGLEYEKAAQTALKFTDRALVINSFSKYYAMTGWRLGWVVAPKEWMRTLERLQQSLAICPPRISQQAALAAFDATEELERNRCAYARNRDAFLNRLPSLGLKSWAPPDGAFYIYADVSCITADSYDLCQRLLHEAGVAVTPGIDFDRQNGASWLRFSYAGAEKEVEEGLRRIEVWLNNQRG